MKNIDRLKNQASIRAEQKQRIDRNETSIPKMFLVLSVPFVDKISYHPSSPSSPTPFLLMMRKLVHLLISEYVPTSVYSPSLQEKRFPVLSLK